VPSSQFSGEGSVQQRLFQRLQRGVLPLVEAGEALGFSFVHSMPSLSMIGRSVRMRPLFSAVTLERMKPIGSSILGR